MNAFISRQQYINAPDCFYVYLGADIKNPNKNFAIEDLELSISFYKDGMIVDTKSSYIGLIDCDEIFHFGDEFYVREIFDNYQVRINGGKYGYIDEKLDFSSAIKVSNLRYKVDVYEEETKVSCQIQNYLQRDLSHIYIYVQFLKKGKIVGGTLLSEYDVAAGGIYDLVTKIDYKVDCDELAYSIVPIIS